MTTLSELMGLDDTPVRVLPKFERRMLALKGIKLPSRAAKSVERVVLGRKAKVIKNVLYNQLGMCIDSFGVQYQVDDVEVNPTVVLLDSILIGVSRSFSAAESHKGSKINIGTLRNMLDKLPALSQQDIMTNYGYNKSQASIYLQACELVIKFYVSSSLKELRQYSESYHEHK